MAASFFFYDLETSGFDARQQRIMQFAGQRTDMELRPVGEPVNILIKMSDDCLPDVDAVLLTGITPQQTLQDGVTEAEFLRTFAQDIAVPSTVFLGFNTIRFDDKFMQSLHYRNFYDPYEWQWQEGRGKWDLLDVVRMTRALRPEGIKWPFDVKGNPTNRLELLTALNGLEHEHAHDALSDVEATINVARLIMNKQPRLFDYLFAMRDKKRIAALVESGEPFVYTSGRYPAEFEKTTVAMQICPHPARQGCAMVYDLRYDPSIWQAKTPEQLVEAWRYKKERDPNDPKLPVKFLSYSHCPAVAQLNVLDADPATRERLQFDKTTIQRHASIVKNTTDLADKLCRALEIMDDKPAQPALVSTEYDVDGAIYDGFFGSEDKRAMSVVRAAVPEELGSLGLSFRDHRLESLLPLYQARNYPKTLTNEGREAWERFRTNRLLAGGPQSRLAKYFARLQDVLAKGGLTGHQEYLLEELKLYAESIMPEQEG